MLKKEVKTAEPKTTAIQYAKTAILLFFTMCCLVSVIIISDIALASERYQNVELITFLILMLFIILSGLYFYLSFTGKKVMREPKQLIMFCAILLVCVIINIIAGNVINIYARPFALFAVLITLLLGKNSGIVSNVIFALIMLIFDIYSTGSFNMTMEQITPLLLSILIGFGFVFLTVRDAKRLKCLLVGIYLSVPTGLICGITSWACGIDLSEIWINIGWACFSSIATSVLFLALLPMFEYIFNVTTNFRLIELADHNNDLLKRLQKEAPGTYNHSYMVSNLAEACAYAIGENTHLARVAAYYHDIGKLKNPEFFTENQSGMGNPHDKLTPELSVAYLKNHITFGVKLAKEYKLPEEIIQVIKEHHGTTLMKFFYYKALNFTDGKLSYSGFVYDGPKPQSKISAIMMIVDACEAALRSVDKQDVMKVRTMVENVVNERINFKQFTECDITLRELSLIKDTIVQNVVGLYHERVGYPSFNITPNTTKI